MFSGLTIANILGVPAATLLGQALGWRAAFWAVCLITAAALTGLYRFLPRTGLRPGAHLAHEFRALAQPAVVLAMLLSVLSSGSLFALLTFIAPVLERITHVAPQGIALFLLGIGVAMTLGNQLGGALGDWRPMPMIILCFLVSIAALCVVPSVAPLPWAMLALVLIWELAVFTLGPLLQLQVMQHAAEAPNLASILNQGAFNLGNALGAWSGAATIAAGYALTDTAYVGAAYAALGLGVSLCLLWRVRHGQPDFI